MTRAYVCMKISKHPPPLLWILHECSCFVEFIKRVGKDKMRRLSSILSLYRNEFNKLNNTGAGMTYSYYHITFELFRNRIFGV